MVACAVYGCTHRSVRDTCSFYRFPTVRRTYSKELKYLAEERRALWVLRIGRSDLDDVKISNARVCGDHFVTGAPAALKDVSHVDWAPSLKLGHEFFKSGGRKQLKNDPSEYVDMTNVITLFKTEDDFENERSILTGDMCVSGSTSSDGSEIDIYRAEDTVSQTHFQLSAHKSEPQHEASEDKLKYFIFDSNKSSDSEDVCVVTHEQALKSAKTLLHYMMNQDDVCQADITLVISYIKKISDKLLNEE